MNNFVHIRRDPIFYIEFTLNPLLLRSRGVDIASVRCVIISCPQVKEIYLPYDTSRTVNVTNRNKQIVMVMGCACADGRRFQMEEQVKTTSTNNSKGQNIVYTYIIWVVFSICRRLTCPLAIWSSLGWQSC